MDCKDVGELLISYLDGELSREEKEPIERHLSTCPHCRQELESLSVTQDQLRRGFAAAASKAVPPQAWAKLQQRLATEEQSRIAVFNLSKSKLRRGVNTLKRGLCSQQPVWKPLAGVLAAVIIASLALIIPPHLGQSQEVLAAEIAQNDPQVHELIPEGSIVKVTKIVRPGQSGIFHVLFLIPGESIWAEQDEGEAVLIDALVNVREKKVIGLRAVSTEGTPITPLSVADKKKAIEIARANSEVQEILDSGAIIRNVIQLPFFQPPEGSLTEKVVAVVLMTPLLDSQAKKAPEPGSQKWIIAIDLGEEKVVRITTEIFP